MAKTDVLEGSSQYMKFERTRFDSTAIGNVQSYHIDKNSIHIYTETGALITFKFCTENMINFTVYTDGIQKPPYPIGDNGPYMIEKDDFNNLDVVKEEKEDNFIRFSNKTLTLMVSKAPFTFDIYNEHDEAIFILNKTKPIEWNCRELYMDISVDEKETFYGTGLKRTYPLNHSTQRHIIEKNTWDGKSVPFFMSRKGYGLFINTTLWDTTMDFTENNIECVLPKSDVLDIYIMIGENDEIMDNYYLLTGKPFMPPKWSLGYWNGRYSYRTQEELLDNAKKFREKDIPCDLIFLDLMWRGVYVPSEVTDLTWDYECFPDPKEMIDTLDQQNFKLFTHVNTTSNINAKDFSNPSHVNHWRQQIIPLIKEGTQGFMVDGGEGKGMNENFMNWNVYGGKFANGMYPEEMANIWGLLYNKTVVEAMRDARPDERMFGLTRAATAGSQRYGLIWFGDHQCKWQELEDEIMAGMNMSMSGMPFWTFDIGGIQGEPKKDLFLRWLQVGCFVPVARTHGRFPKEPWLYGKPTEEAARKILKLRMALIPYIYTVMWEMHKKNIPPVRPLAWEFKEDDTAVTIWDEWLLGESILVAPIYKKDQFSREVYLPEGKWLELSTGKIFDGKQNISVDAPLDEIPLFFRHGTLLPTCESSNHVQHEAVDYLNVYMFPKKEETSTFSYYEDDGKTAHYMDNHTLTNITCRLQDSTLEISVDRDTYNHLDVTNEYRFRVVCDNINRVKINNQEADYEYVMDHLLNRQILRTTAQLEDTK